MVRKGKYNNSKVTNFTYEDLANKISEIKGETPWKPSQVMAKVNQILLPSQAELFFTPFAIIIEGREDLAYLTSYLACKDHLEELKTNGCNFIMAEGKPNMINIVAITQGLDIPFFAIFDGDNDKKDQKGNNLKINRTILKLCELSPTDDDLKDNYWASNAVMWNTNLAKELFEELTPSVKNDIMSEARSCHDLEDNVEEKNCMLITAFIEGMTEKKVKCPSLEKLATQITSAVKEVGH